MFVEARAKRDLIQLTAKLTAKPADGDGRLYTVRARSHELAGMVDTDVRHQTLLTSMTCRGRGFESLTAHHADERICVILVVCRVADDRYLSPCLGVGVAPTRSYVPPNRESRPTIRLQRDSTSATSSVCCDGFMQKVV